MTFFDLMHYTWTFCALLVELATMFWGVSRVRFANGYGDIAVTALFVSLARVAVSVAGTVLTALIFTGGGLLLLSASAALLSKALTDSRLILPLAMPMLVNYLVIFGTLASCYWYFVRPQEKNL